ncbi:hypothetical protein [Pseudomonas pseudonitroreducens]|uniref:hypothetical protein n=1 Tax=Pseudomonas pseudonitroreducens TaxID=2892326 RepID=UPI001F3897A0|nr:hypothetical protein [Pseudomonas pseudonitroreducens]
MSKTLHDAVKDAADADYRSEQRRAFAVAAALEVIAARAPAMSTSGQLEHEMQKLSSYADLIQAALAKA